MKILSILSGKFEIIRQSHLINVLDQYAENFTVFNFADESYFDGENFFDALHIRAPDLYMNFENKNAIEKNVFFEELIQEQKPDRILIAGSNDCSFREVNVLKKETPVFYLGAGKSYFQNQNRKINEKTVSGVNEIFLCFNEREKENLIDEGIERKRIFVVGNPLAEVLQAISEENEKEETFFPSEAEKFEYFFISLEDIGNLESAVRLKNIFKGLELLSETFDKKIFVRVPRKFQEVLRNLNAAKTSEKILFVENVGFKQLLRIQKNALAVLTDDETLQEICTIFEIPNVLLLDETNNREAFECGSAFLCGADAEEILSAARMVISQPANWKLPREYETENAAQIVSKIILSKMIC